jgi:uncharacterized coiled-coil DUF342 family protein
MDNNINDKIYKLRFLSERLKLLQEENSRSRNEYSELNNEISFLISQIGQLTYELYSTTEDLEKMSELKGWDKWYYGFFQRANFVLLLVPTIIGVIIVFKGMEKIQAVKAETSQVVKKRDSLIQRQKDTIKELQFFSNYDSVSLRWKRDVFNKN